MTERHTTPNAAATRADEMPGTFDVFLSHNSADKSTVQRLAEQLRVRGLKPWLDAWELVPGTDWQDGLATGLTVSCACAVFLGPADLGAWQRPEVKVALDRSAHDPAFRVFLVLLPGMPDPFDPTTIDPFLSMRTWVDLRAGAEDVAAVARLARAVRGLPLAGPPTRPGADVPCPYRGLLPFREEDRRWFFGREGDVQRLVEKLKAGQFLAVLGPSGSGKSSLTLAGLLPQLRAGAVPGSESWQILVLTPTAQPLQAVAAAVLSTNPSLDAPALLSELRSSDETLSVRLRGQGRRVLLVVDQAEEAFTECKDIDQRERFFANLLDAAAPGGPCTVVLTMRADFYPEAAALPALAQAISSHQYLVGPLGPDELRQVVEQPALAAGLSLEPGLTEAILRDVAGEPGALPLLEHALFELWNRRQDDTLTLASLAEIGGVGGAVSRRADEIWNAFTPRQQSAAREVLLRLIHPGEGAVDTRRPALLADIPTSTVATDDVQRVVQVLSDARLLTTNTDRRGTVVEVSHEALVRAWPRLRQWMAEHREDLATREQISRAADDWDQERTPDLLWRGARLGVALEWEATHASELNTLEVDFLGASRRAEQAERRRRSRRLTAVIAALAALSVMAVVAGLRAVQQADVARGNELRAAALALAAQAGQVERDNPALALALAAEAWSSTDHPLPVAVKAMVSARTAFHQRRWHMVGEMLAGPRQFPGGVAFDRAGTRLAVAFADGTIRLLSPRDGRAVGGPLVSDHGSVNDVAFSPDGSRLAAAYHDGTVLLWNPATRQPVTTLPPAGHGAASDVAFNPDGARLAVSHNDGTVEQWDPGHARTIGNPVDAGQGEVNAVAYSVDGTRLATAGYDGSVRLWDAGTGRALNRVVLSERYPVYGVAFSPDGRLLASADASGTVGLLNPATGDPVARPLDTSQQMVLGLAFSHDGTELATVGYDGTVRTWDARSREPLGGPLAGHQGMTYGVAFSPDGSRLAAAGNDGTVLWASAPSAALTRELPTGGPLSADELAFDQRGVRLVAGGRVSGGPSTQRGLGAIQLWNTRGGPATGRLLTTGGAEVDAVAFSPDGREVAAGSQGGSIQVWDTTHGDAVGVPIRAHHGAVDDVAFSPAGDRLAAGYVDGTVVQWDLAGGTAIGRPIDTHQRSVYAVTYSPDGARLATGGDDGSVRLWDAAGGKSLGRPMRTTAYVKDVVFSPDGSLLAAASADAVRLWDPTTGRMVGTPLVSSTTLIGNSGTDGVNTAAFSPDGDLLASANGDGVVQLWDPATGNELGRLHVAAPAAVVAFSPDGRRLAVVAAGTVQVSDVLDVSRACSLVRPLVTSRQVSAYFSSPHAPRGCRLR